MSDLKSEDRHVFIADTHFGHNGISDKFRNQFNSDKEHNDFIHNNIMMEGCRQKTLWILGDTFFKTREFWRLEEYRRVYQQVNVILGNHCHSGLPRYALQFKNVNVFGVVKRFGVWLTHVPVPEYELYRGNCIHGHLHDKKVPVQPDKYFCVSCENIDYKPISLGKIKSIMEWSNLIQLHFNL